MKSKVSLPLVTSTGDGCRGGLGGGAAGVGAGVDDGR